MKGIDSLTSLKEKRVEQERPSDKEGLGFPSKSHQRFLEVSHTSILSPTLTDEAAGAEAVHCGGI